MLCDTRGDCDVLKLLFSAGAVLQSTDDCGRTPLHLAAMHGHLAAVQYLVGVQYSRATRAFSFVLLAAHPSIDGVFHVACVCVRVSCVCRVCVVCVSCVCRVCVVCVSCVCRVCRVCRVCVCVCVCVCRVQQEASILARDNNSWIIFKDSTPLHLAAARGHTDIVLFLLETSFNKSTIPLRSSPFFFVLRSYSLRPCRHCGARRRRRCRRVPGIG
jgi:ankyrin repeat protein